MDNNKKIVLGQFYTTEEIWLKKQVNDFIVNSGMKVAYDPFAGGGDLLKVAEKIGFNSIVGMDIAENLGWKYNDSLIDIPHLDDAIIITNPPYISNYSASRKKIGNELKKYFDTTVYDDVYLLALDKMLDAEDYVVAIIPETFINSNYKRKNRLFSITILEENPFNDTDTPVIVACFDKVKKRLDDVSVYKNDKYINSLENIEKMRVYPNRNVKMSFNDKNGWLGVRCVDNTNSKDMITFNFKEKIDYNWSNRIKASSRLITLIEIDIPLEKRKEFIFECNSLLESLRNNTSDIIFSPFKGNMKNGKRRRRLDFMTCRAIIEIAYYKIIDGMGR